MKKGHVKTGSIIDIVTDPFGLTYNEIYDIIGEPGSKILYSLLYKNISQRESHTLWIRDIFRDAGTAKYIFELPDDKCIETVCIKRKTGMTACVSTQAGCPVQCIFCESGREGLIRNLTASEIVQQVAFLKGQINRIVFMGIGEPLYNYDSLIRAIHILRDRDGMNFPTDGITISTVGPIKPLKKLREEHIKIQLILSLHATAQNVRDYLIPGMRGNDINETVKTALSYSKRHGRKLVIAYLLLPGINDKYSDIRQLVEWFKHENVMVNLLEYNQTNQRIIKRINKQDIERFKNKLESNGVEAKIRVSHGNKIKAACGQLAGKYNRAAQKFS